jgi:hypothetical protein
MDSDMYVINPFRLKLSPIKAVNKSFVFREEIKLNTKKIVNMSASILLAILLNNIFLDTKMWPSKKAAIKIKSQNFGELNGSCISGFRINVIAEQNSSI